MDKVYRQQMNLSAVTCRHVCSRPLPNNINKLQAHGSMHLGSHACLTIMHSSHQLMYVGSGNVVGTEHSMACTIAQAVADHFAFEQMARVEAQAQAAHLAGKLADTAAALQARYATTDRPLMCSHAA